MEVGRPPEDLGQVRMKFGVNSTNGRVVDTNRFRYLTSRLIKIQERNDLDDLKSRKRFHGSGSGSRVMFWCICIVLNLL